MLWKLIETNGTTHNNTQLKLRLPWVRVNSTPNTHWLIAAARLIVEYAGAEWVPVDEGLPGYGELAVFNTPSGTTRTMALSDVSVMAVREKIGAIR